MSDDVNDYTQPCLEVLNRIITFSHFLPVRNADWVASNAPKLYTALDHTFNSVWRLYEGAPREVYETAFDDKPEVMKSVELKWALSWAKNAGIISHHGPAGTAGWVIYRGTTISRQELGRVSPFDVQTLSDTLSDAMKYSNAMRVQELKKQQDALSRAAKIENELKAEKKKRALSSQLTWS